MPFEIDVLAVGEGERSGDAIAVRFGMPGAYQILVYDGGTQAAGEQLVQHIQTYYQTTRVDYVVNSHPDADHAAGLSVVLDKLDVGELWLHRPWAYSRTILGYFQNGRLTDNSLSEYLKEAMSAAHSLEELAISRNIPIHEPFRGASIGPFVVLSPERDWYVHTLIAEFEKSPEQKRATEASAGLLKRAMAEAARGVAGWLAEHWGLESLREDVSTSAENESSSVLFGVIDNKGILLTGDSGVRALTATVAYAESRGVSLPLHLQYVQVPHHGGRHNVSTSVLDRLIGSRKASDDGKFRMNAFASVGAKSTTHPRKAVVNAFLRRGARVYQTKGTPVLFANGMQDRGWLPAPTLSFSAQVDAWE